MAYKHLQVAAQLVCALALRLKAVGASPLTPLHIEGEKNDLTDIPSRSFGSEPQWHCRSNDELLTLVNQKFPLPHQRSWTVFRLNSAISTRVISVLRMMPTSLDEWRRLPRAGCHTTPTGVPTSGLWEWTLTCRGSPTEQGCDSSPVLPRESGRASKAAASKSELRRFQARSRPLVRRLRWTTSETRPRS